MSTKDHYFSTDGAILVCINKVLLQNESVKVENSLSKKAVDKISSMIDAHNCDIELKKRLLKK